MVEGNNFDRVAEHGAGGGACQCDDACLRQSRSAGECGSSTSRETWPAIRVGRRSPALEWSGVQVGPGPLGGSASSTIGLGSRAMVALEPRLLLRRRALAAVGSLQSSVSDSRQPRVDSRKPSDVGIDRGSAGLQLAKRPPSRPEGPTGESRRDFGAGGETRTTVSACPTIHARENHHLPETYLHDVPAGSRCAQGKRR